jgi:hypothetical protein
MPANNTKLHDDNSPCEEIVWFMATKPEPLKILKAIDLLCPSCSQAMRDFLTRENTAC